MAQPNNQRDWKVVLLMFEIIGMATSEQRYRLLLAMQREIEMFVTQAPVPHE
jgi:hypothetical protein